MKVTTVMAESSTVEVMLEAEHPAEVALINLMGQCKAECLVMLPPDTKDEPAEPKLRITVQIKGARSC